MCGSRIVWCGCESVRDEDVVSVALFLVLSSSCRRIGRRAFGFLLLADILVQLNVLLPAELRFALCRLAVLLRSLIFDRQLGLGDVPTNSVERLPCQQRFDLLPLCVSSEDHPASRLQHLDPNLCRQTRHSFSPAEPPCPTPPSTALAPARLLALHLGDALLEHALDPPHAVVVSAMLPLTFIYE